MDRQFVAALKWSILMRISFNSWLDTCLDTVAVSVPPAVSTRTGQDTTRRGWTCLDRTAQNRTQKNRTSLGMTEQDTTGRDGIGRDWARKDRAGQDSTRGDKGGQIGSNTTGRDMKSCDGTTYGTTP